MLRSRWLLLILGLTLPGLFCLTFSLHGTASSATTPTAPALNGADDPEDEQPPLLSSVLSPSRHRLIPPRRYVRTPAPPSASPSQLGVRDTRRPPTA